MNFYRKWFTLVEILVVIAIIGIFAASTMYFTQDSRIDQTKAERLANSIHDTMKNARNNMLIGRWVYSGSTLYPTDRRTIRITGWGISTDYAINGTSTGTETNVVYPFFDNDPQYKITDISVSSGILSNGQKINWDHTGVTLADITIEPNGSMTILALKWGMPISETINTVRVTAGYGNFTQSVMLDRLVWRSEVVQAQGDQIFSSDPACAAPPSCVGLGSCTATPGTPSMVDQAWVYSALNCGFTCNTNYNWNGTYCQPATQTGNCTPTPPANAYPVTPSTFTQTWNGTTFAPTTYPWAHWAGTCGFNCNTHYIWDGISTCAPETRTWPCSGTLPVHATAPSSTFTQTYNGTIFAPATRSYSEWWVECGFDCDTNYNWNSVTSTCDAATTTFNCAAKPAVGTVWNTVSSYIQTWDGSAWLPSGGPTLYDATPSTTACRYRCALYYSWNIWTSTCDADTRTWTCGGTFPLNATATTPTTYTQTWDGSVWVPTTNWAQAPVATCGFNCNAWHTWNGSICEPHIHGACNPVFDSYTAPTPTCATGNPTGISGTGPWTWGCTSPNGGTSTATNACSANKRVDCVGSWGSCASGSQTYTVTTPLANGWTVCEAANGATRVCGTPGVCNNTTQFACTSGTSVSNNPGSCGWNSTWNCNSLDGGTNASCSLANAACIHGACNPVFDSYTAPTPTCATGNPTGISGTGPWTWGCTSPNGGTSTATNACSANKRVDCVEWWGACVLGSRNNIITTPPANGGNACVNPPTQTCGTPGICGTAHAQSHPTIPVSWLCAQGNPTTVTGTGPWNWSCNSTNGGSNTSCSANLAANSCNPSLPTCAWSSCNLTYSPSSVNQPWNKDASSCGFACSGTWYGANCLDRNCSYNTYNWSCNVSCGGGNYYTYYNITTWSSWWGSCSVTNGWYAWLGGSCNAFACPVPASFSWWGSCSGGIQYGTCTEQTGGHPTTCASLGRVVGTNSQSCGTPGVCNNSVQFACSNGTSVSNNAGSCGWNSTWSCNSTNGGTNASCSRANAACTTPASFSWWGSCSGGIQYGTCTEQTGGHPTTCASLGRVVGTNSQSCGTPGVCNNSVQFACSNGTSVSNNAGSCGWNSTWSCNSTNGGTNASCSRANAACGPRHIGYGIMVVYTISGCPYAYGAGNGIQTWTMWTSPNPSMCNSGETLSVNSIAPVVITSLSGPAAGAKYGRPECVASSYSETREKQVTCQ